MHVIRAYLGPVAAAAAFATLVAAVIYADRRSADEWEAFKIARSCEKVGEVAATVAPSFGVSTNGTPVFASTYVPGQTGRKCNDGVTYWR